MPEKDAAYIRELFARKQDEELQRLRAAKQAHEYVRALASGREDAEVIFRA